MADLLNIPIFPLPIVVFPDQRVPLHIFEERYKMMMKDCLAEGGTKIFGVALSEKVLHPVGCAVEISSVIAMHEDGKLDLVVVGRRRFRIRTLYDAPPYKRADIEIVDDRIELIDEKLRQKAITLHIRLIELVEKETRMRDLNGYDRLSFILAQTAGVNLEFRQVLLEMLSENERLSALVEYYQRVIPAVVEKESKKEVVRSNGHFHKSPLTDDES